MELQADEYENSLAHYGILRKSGRYPWGTGNNPKQRSKTFLDILEEHRKNGLSESEIAKLYDDRDKGFPFTVADLRAVKSRSVHIQKEEQIRTAQRLKDEGNGASAIARQMGVNESTVRSLLEPGRLEKLDILQKTADVLKRQVDEKGFIDIGAHVERDVPGLLGDPSTGMGISKDKFNTAVSLLKEEGYAVATFKGNQVGTGEKTTYKVLLKPPKPNMTQQEIQRYAFLNREKLQLISKKSDDGGRTYKELTFQPPLNIDPKRVGIRYKEDGGADADGVIYVRPGVPDVSLGKSHYAQVRVAVGGSHFLKGMAVYKDDLPPGVDLVFNTNKSDTGNKLDAMKPLKRVKETDEVDWKNPFGAFPKLGGQLKDDDGNVTSVMNRLSEQGDWDKWSKNLSSQMLSKQSPSLAKSQLDLTHARRQREFDEIKALTNPLIKRKLLESFSDETDSAAVHLKAAAMPKQATKVLLPVSSVKPNEIFAPSYKDGDRVALVRFPHAGTFEIPELTVNNKNREALRLFRGHGKEVQAPDAVGIHPKVAERLSGADFDGDTVVVIPNNRGSIRSRPALEGLKGFDPHTYKVPTPEEDPVKGRVTMTSRVKGTEMGKVTNLISDMTIRGASDNEIAAAVRHSMVVIDAEKHNLDYKASEKQNGILGLKRKYQAGINPDTGRPSMGASTLITRATSRKDVPKRKPRPASEGGPIDPVTGRKMFVPTGETDKHGNVKTFRSTKLAETDDAFTLLSEGRGTPIERIYAEHSNRLKTMANEARKEYTVTQPLRRSSSAAKVYSAEVQQLDSKLNEALKNAPLERRAQTVANQIVGERRRANPDMDASEKKKIRGQALEEARARIGAKKDPIPITDREWEAIQAGAISIDKLKNILNNTDVDKLRERATPRTKPVMSPVVARRAAALRSSGATLAEISEALGVPVSTLQSSFADGG